MQVMHDIRFIRDNSEDFDKALGRRGVNAASEEILKIDEARRSAILSAETAQAEQNKSSKLIGAAKASGDEKEFEKLRKLVADKKNEVADMNADMKFL
jgi:seryl-tRNA synthetase